MQGAARGADSLYSLEPLKAQIEKHVSLAALMASKRDFAVGAVSGAAPPHVAAEIQATRDALDEANKRSVPIFVLAPRVWFDEDNPEKGNRNPSTEFSPHLIAKAIAHGREVAADSSLWVWPPA